MKPEIAQMINETRKQIGKDHNAVDFYKCKFVVSDYKIVAFLDRISINFVDVDCSDNGISTGPITLYVKGQRPLPTSAKRANFDEDDNTLRIDDEVYLVQDSGELDMFAEELHCKARQARRNFLWNFCVQLTSEQISGEG